MKKKHFFLFSTYLFFLAIMNAEPQSSQRLPDTTTLLLSYVENDAELKNLILAAKKSALSYQSAKIDTGFDVTLSSGSVTLQVNDDGTKLTAKPSVKMSLPQASNLSVTAQTSFSSESSNTSLSNTSVAVGIDIISSAVISNKLTKLKAERAVTEAQRKIEKRAIAAEKEFYTALKSLLSSINTIMTKRQTLYEDSIDFEAKKVQGYSESSSTYRQAELKVISDQHEIDSAIHSFKYDCVVFYKNCGYDLEIDDKADLMSFVPSGIDEVEPADILKFDKALYTEIENANWTYYINSMERSSKKNYGLSASAGYTFDNSITNSDSIDAGLSGTFGGLTVGVGISLPVKSSQSSISPAYTLSASLNPNTFRKNSITKQQNVLTEEQELLAIQTAESAYETKLVEFQQKLDTLLWEKKTVEENISMYGDLEKDMAQLYQQGYINETEYLSAKNNLNSSIIKKISNLIDLIIYNDDVISNFVSEN
ncbi:MAG: TolC family protein [Treponema sp.]|nr:TolC family protein [Treponema sp.]